ncbi:NACHT nucleoside triphosphatase [Penicillium fimorum]|uniref:NACHT nucleoside triphosphatase n=1 Tax=Penicillium fimorum TaxID=1882269 RepID=A0A9X0C6G0_9EURO|nr:NACHT nucleoside triphosphatase [Penicillium fimorum]
MAENPQSQAEQSVLAQNNTSPKTSFRRKRLHHDAYTIGWVCALPKEQTAAIAMLDEEHEALPIPRNDHNAYTLGSICGHSVVIACLPNMGTNPAATVATTMINTFQSIRFGLMVGIGGGNPSKVKLGDVVVSQPVADYHGVVQWDMGKLERGGQFVHTGSLNRPPTALLNASNRLKSKHEMYGSKINEYLDDVERKIPRLAPKYTRRECLEDPLLVPERVRRTPTEVHFLSRLWQAIITVVAHFLGIWAVGPVNEENGQLLEKAERARSQREVKVHYGLIASGNKVIKDSQSRDSLDKAFGGHLLCVEMEAAGLMNDFPCIVIRGICDYADSRKEKAWQEYAAAVAAAYAKELLECVQPSVVDAESSAKAILEKVQQQIDGVQQTAVATKATTDSIRSDLYSDKIIRWLCPPDPSTNVNQARTVRHEGTGAWLLENPAFQSWYLGSHRHLWLHGLAGCGKTVLSAIVLDYLTKETDGLILSFFFDFNDIAKQTLEGMLRSLAFQLYQSRVESAIHLDALFQVHQNGKDQPTTKALCVVVLKMLIAQSKVYIVLDALDESKTRNDAIEWIKDVVSKPELAHVQLLLTGRPESEFLRHIPPLIGNENCQPLNQSAVNSDIRSWVSAQLSRRHDFIEKHLPRDLLEEIRRKVGDGADGMFRWAFCQLDSLAKCPHEAAIEEALVSLPQTLNETYQRMIASIPMGRKNDAIRLLQFLVHSKEPLKLAEAKEVIATPIESGSQGFNIKRRLFCVTDILGYCPGLLTVFHASEAELHLAHFSVKEYLLGENDFTIATASIPITRTCLTYLTDINGTDSEIRRDFPLARYAAKTWTRHAAIAQASEEIVRATVTFLERETTFQRWAHLYQGDIFWDTEPGPASGSRIYYASFDGLVAPVKELIGNGADVNAKGGRYGNALQAASYRGHQEIITLLLDKGADVNAKGAYYSTALQAASAAGYQEIVTLLLDKGADVNAEGGRYGNALQAASAKGYQEIVTLLLDKGADVNAQGGRYSNALYAASAQDYQEIVTLLLDRGADVNAEGGNYGNALQAASAEGHQEIVTLLLDKGADVNAQGGRYSNALYAASAEGHQEIVTLLLDKGADVNAKGGDYGNALQAASANGDQGIVTLLLDKGADVNAEGGYYGNALQAASAEGHQEIVTLLLDKGADVNAKGAYYSTALQAASAEGHQEIITLLLDKGADVNAEGGNYGNALQAASVKGHQEIVKLLLDKGADVNAEGGNYGNALQAASVKGHQEIVTLLLDKGADVNAQGSFYGNALQAASAKGYQEIITILLDKGADVNAEGGYYGNALQAASAEGHQEIITLLLDKGADVNAEGGNYGNALQAASVKGHQEIVTLLLDKGADVNAKGAYYSTALQAASAAGYQEIVTLLLDKGADVNTEGGRYGNALQAASYRGHQEIITLLLDKGADVNAEGGNYGNALQAASVKGHQEIVTLLLDKGADVNAKGAYYSTALQAASAAGYQEIVTLLLDKGADVNTEGGRYGNALQAASYRGHQEIITLLLDKGADVNAEGGNYGNALQAASAEGHQEIVTLLLDKGADVNAKGAYYSTALQATSAEGHQEIVTLLLDKGADVNAEGGNYGNALQATSAKGYQEI